MSTDKTILSSSVLVDLYKDSLVVVEDIPLENKATVEQTIETKKEEIKEVKWEGPIKSLGEHNKKITVIVNDPNSVHLNEMDFILLTSILNACRLTIADIALINIGKQPVGLHQILQELPSTLVLSFAVDATQLKVKLPSTLYKLTQLGETHILFSNALSTMQGTGVEAKQEKAKLWTVLKKIFEL
jgi:hypothetical protein